MPFPSRVFCWDRRTHAVSLHSVGWTDGSAVGRYSARWTAAIAALTLYRDEFRIAFGDGSYRWVVAQAEPYRESDSTLTGWFGTLTDVHDRWTLVRGRPQPDADGSIERWIGLNIDIDDQHRADERREQFVRLVENSDDFISIGDLEGNVTYLNQAGLHMLSIAPSGIATITRDIRERQRVEAGLRTLAETGAVMFRSLDYEQTLQNVAAAATRNFSSYCIVDMVDEQNRLQLVAFAHRDPALAGILELASIARSTSGNHPVARAVRDGASTLVESVGTNWVAETGIDPGSQDAVRALSARSMLCVPVRTSVDGAVVGALSCAADDVSPRPCRPHHSPRPYRNFRACGSQPTIGRGTARPRSAAIGTMPSCSMTDESSSRWATCSATG